MMNSQNGNSWPPSTGSGGPPPNNEHHNQVQQRPLGNFGPNHTIHQGLPPQIGGPPLLPQSGPFYTSQTNGHALPNPVGLTQASPLQPNRGPPLSHQQHSPPGIQHHQIQGPGYALPALGPAVQQQQSPQAAMNSEREREREQEVDRQRQQDILAQRELELLEQQHRDQHQSTLENHTGSIPLQQPVASRVPATLHGPNGILANLGAGAGPNPPPATLGAPSGPGNVFANGMQQRDESPSRAFMQQAPQNIPNQQLLGFGNAVTPQQLPNGMAALSQGQQPILNDALSYLDQVKVRFVDQAEVYNQFLDIMKDFKSQAIDTPGVIERVSTLFAGHPELIQGFNTFLPPGYRIECGTRDDPNAIRVTTPMGTTVSQMPSVHNRLNGGLRPNGVHAPDVGNTARQGLYGDGPPLNGDWQGQQQEHMENAHDNAFSSSRRMVELPMFGGQSNIGHSTAIPYDKDDQFVDADAAAIAHQEEQRGVSHLSKAVSVVATNGIPSRHSLTQGSLNGPQTSSLSQTATGTHAPGSSLVSGNQLGVEKRGPVEFNHAIGYVNKIKNRFATQPEIYKQFLEILQTYQRESKPIQDVYAQVTQLFNSAPDLLEDFKQFLPESAAQAKAQAAARQATEDAAMLSNVRGEAVYNHMQPNQVQTPRPEMKMPPVGNFAPPPSVGKENKKRRGGAGSQITGGAAALDQASVLSAQNNKNGNIRSGTVNKRARIEQAKPAAPEIPPVSPTLVPSLPQPIPPTSSASAMAEELAFFDRVKKFLANKQTFNEFLKLCNLFTQDLVDKNVLMHKASSFIGSNPDLMTWFKAFIKYDGNDEIIENKPQISSDKVVLSQCRGLGPSYRLLPKRERLRRCSGRDEMCQSVLNDEWSSHPTWASEDSGFIAHRKNSYEESIHRIEEERHDYDINIEACLRTIQLMEPIVQQIKLMSDEERNSFVLPAGIGGQSETIYQRIIKKIYDRERGGKVIEDMFKNPAAVLPIVLGRLKQKSEEWKASQREWEKVWREQTHKLFWKSLDHQGISVKSADKRQFQPKTLQTEIQVRYEEQRALRQRSQRNEMVPKYQFLFTFNDKEVIQDASHLILTHLHHAYVGNAADQTKLETFFKTFIPAFFDLDRESFNRRMADVYDTSPPNEEAEDDLVTNEELNAGRGRRAANGKKANLLRGVLERGQNGKSSHKGKEDQDSKESTPDVFSMDEDTATSMETPSEQPVRVDAAEHRWMEHPPAGNRGNRQDIDHNQPYKRDSYNLYASSNIYCFFRMFEMLYERLAKIKANEKGVHEDVRRAKIPKPAHDLKLVDKTPSDLFYDVSPNANYYRQIVRMCEDVIKERVDIIHLEETLRRFYMQNGWQLYSFDKMLTAMVRFAWQILASDNKDKSLDIINLFYKDRNETETTHQAELTYRKQVEKLTKDADIYRITYTSTTGTATIQVFKKDDKTFEIDEMAATARWSYYISTFAMRDLTEGLDLSKIDWPFLKRNMPPMLDTEDEYTRVYTPQWNEDGLVIRISSNNYHMLYDPLTQDWWVHNAAVQKRGLQGEAVLKDERKQKFEEKFVLNNAWMVGKSVEEVDQINQEYRRWVTEGPKATENEPPANSADQPAAGTDEAMAGA